MYFNDFGVIRRIRIMENAITTMYLNDWEAIRPIRMIEKHHKNNVFEWLGGNQTYQND